MGGSLGTIPSCQPTFQYVSAEFQHADCWGPLSLGGPVWLLGKGYFQQFWSGGQPQQLCMSQAFPQK